MADTVLLKKFSTEFKIGILIFTLIPLIHLSCATTTMGKSVEEVQTSNSFLITCTVSDLSGIVVFYKNSKEKGRCEPSVIPGFPAVCVAGFTQDPITNITTYSVASANATNEDGTWSCTHSTESSNDLNVIVYEFPATNSIGNNQAYLPNNIVATTMDGTQLIVNISECVNPAPTTNWTFYQDCEGSSISPTILITSTITTDPDIACSPPYSAYKSTIRNTDMTNAVIGYDHCYRVRSFVAYPGTSFTSVPVMFSVNVTFTSQSEAKKSWIHVKVSSVINTVWSAVKWLFYLLWRVLCCLFCKQCCRPFTVIVALAWCYYLSRRYVLNGRVVYGIQIAVVAAISQLVTIISAVIVLTIYEEQNESSVTPIMLSQMPLCALLSVGIFFLWKAYFCQREWTYTEFFKDRLIDCFLSTYGIKFATINKDKIWFKVWAKDDVLLTLFGNNDMPFLYIIMGYGNRNRKFKSISSRPVVACDDVFGTDNKYRTFFLTCEKHCVTVVRVLNGKEETVLKWPLRNCPEPSDIDHSPLNIGDIRISNYMQDLTKKKESKETTETAETTVTEADATKTAITISQSGTSGEWIFFIRKGDCLLEDDDDSRWSKNLTLILVILLPVALIVVAILFIIKLINANGKGEEKGQPNATIAAGDKWMRTDVGKNTLNLPPVDLNKKTDAVPDDTEQTEKKAKSRKKKNRNEIRQTQADTENNTVQTEIVQ